MLKGGAVPLRSGARQAGGKLAVSWRVGAALSGVGFSVAGWFPFSATLPKGAVGGCSFMPYMLIMEPVILFLRQVSGIKTIKQ